MPVYATPSRPFSRLADKPRRRRGGAISLTPLIDVVFILLVFFMLASSFMDWRLIELDAPGRSGGPPSMDGALLVEVRGDGLRLAGEPLSQAALLARVRERLQAVPEQKVLVKTTDGVTLQQAVSVVDALAAAGVVQLSLIR